MKILFVQLRFESNTAVMILSSVLNCKGFETDVMIIEGEPDYIYKIKEEIKPDIVAFPCTTVDMKKLVAINKNLKESYSFFSVFGGAHPTFFPELIEEEPSIDAICIGEGEHAIIELAERLQTGADCNNISNLHVRGKNGGISKNQLIPLIEDLDSLPFMNRHIYDKYYNNPYMLENVPIRFLSSRGCPYKCTYCFNHKFYQLYGIKGNRVRKRSVDSLLKEINEVRKDFNIPMVSFVDDIFCISRAWVRQFAIKYRSEVNLPYSINTRPNTITEEIAGLLAMSKCYYVTFSIETGDDYLRNKLLKRNMSEDEIIRAAHLLHQHDIPFATGNMLGIPGETFATLRKTLEVNRRCAPHYAWASLFQPFPKLELTNYAIEHGFFNGDFRNIGNDQFTDSALQFKKKKEIVRFHKFFAFLVKYPYLYPLARLIITLPFDPVYNWVFKRYKYRLNKPVIEASKETIEKQYKEPLFTALIYLCKDLLDEFASKKV